MSPEQLRLRFSRAMNAELAQNTDLMKRIDTMLWILFPHGVEPSDYGDVVLAVRTLDRLSRSIGDDFIEEEDTAPGVMAEAMMAPEQAAASMRDFSGAGFGSAERDGVVCDHVDEISDGVVQAFVEDRTAPVTPRAIEQARTREEKPWRNIGSFDLAEFADLF